MNVIVISNKNVMFFGASVFVINLWHFFDNLKVFYVDLSNLVCGFLWVMTAAF